MQRSIPTGRICLQCGAGMHVPGAGEPLQLQLPYLWTRTLLRVQLNQLNPAERVMLFRAET